MNRIIILGNGFDLAHGLNTSYNSFISNFWNRLIQKVMNSPAHERYIDDFLDIRKTPENWYPECSWERFENFKASLKGVNSILKFRNDFLKELSNHLGSTNWVDIEESYYKLLKLSYSKTQKSKTSIDTLNQNFQTFKDLLEEYLELQVKDFTVDNSTTINIGRNIYEDFNFNHFCSSVQNAKIEREYQKVEKYLKNLTDKEDIQNIQPYQDQFLLESVYDLKQDPLKLNLKIRELILSEYASEYFNLCPSEVLFLNFNYIETERYYLKPSKFRELLYHQKPRVTINHIHGLIKNQQNPMIFGFGDELDEDYKKIESLNNNEYLKNVKSINYLETTNYKKLLEFIESDYFQIGIMGHSCGISDRTLLNTLFEHSNCGSIKIHYHKRSDGSDNYSDVVRNISRNFNDKAMMRDKVVNKIWSNPIL